MRKIVLTFGLIAGGIMAGMFLLVTVPFHDQIGWDKGLIVGYSSMVAAFLMVYFGVRRYRDTVGGGQVSFGGALKVGALISLVAVLVYIVTWEIVYNTLMPDFMDKYAAHVIQQMQADSASAAAIAEKTQQMAEFKEIYRNPLVRAAFTALEPLPVALIFTLVTAGLLSRKRRPAGAATS